MFTDSGNQVTENAPLMIGFPRRRTLHVIVAFLLALILLLMSNPAVHAATRVEKNQDIVFLVDVSSSMVDIFDDVRRAILNYVDQTRTGDNVVLITFGESVTLAIRQRISSEEDIKLIEREFAALTPNQYYTDITGALDKGLSEMDRLEEKYPEHLRTLILLSDGKNNPPGSDTAGLSFEEILKRYPIILERGASAFFYLSLGEEPDEEVVSFIEKVAGESFDVNRVTPDPIEQQQPLAFSQIFVEPVSLDVGTVLGPEATASISLALFPARGNPAGKVIMASVSGQFRGNPTWRTIAELKPRSFNCRDKPWTQTLTLSLDSLNEGTVVGTLKLEPLPGQVLFIEPSEIPITMTIRQPRVEVLQKGWVEFGPIYPQQAYRETKKVALMANTAATDEPIRPVPDILLPKGISLTTSVEKTADGQELAITVSSNESYDPTHSMTFEGAVKLAGAEHALNFSKDKVEVKIYVAPPVAEGTSMTFAVSALLKRIGTWLLYAIIPTLLALIVAFAAYWWLRLRPQSLLEGKLLLLHLKGKQPPGSRVVTVNLHNVGKTIGTSNITFGSSEEAGVTLPHKSVNAFHCRIFAGFDKGTKRIQIEPIGASPVIVNLEKISGATPLSDRDLIEIGAYAFRFENPHPYKQLVVRYLDGRIEKGTPASWDIESDGFELLPRDALPGSAEEIFISFNQLKAVYFVRDFDGQIGKKLLSPASQIKGVHMKLIFHDGEEMEGYTSESYSPSSARFYFFPADQSGNTISLVVERQHLQNVEVLDQTGQT